MSNPRYEVYCRSCGCQMKLRRGKFGEFWGCSAYPHCKATMNKRDGALQAAGDEGDPEEGEMVRWDR